MHINWIFPVAAWFLAPLLPGFINQVKARFAGRQGPPVWQLYFDLYKLMRKGAVYSRSTSFIIKAAPLLILACTALATLMLPWGGLSAPISFAGDIILLVYLLGLARFSLVLSALDTGSAFEGMGASREVQFSALSEPALLLGFLVLIMHTGSMGLSGIALGITFADWATSAPLLIMVAFAWYFILLTENCRIPVDDPNTHLELTMIHEVMILDNSGVDLAFLEYASALKLWIFGSLLVNLVLPVRFEAVWLQLAAFLAGMAVMTILIGITESVMAQLKLLNIPKMLVGSATLSLIALMIKLTEFYQ